MKLRALVISDDQMMVFAAEARRRFEKRVVGRIRSAFPEQAEAWGAAPLARYARRGIALAESSDIRQRGRITELVLLMFETAYDPDARGDQAWLAPILEDDSLHPADKIRRARVRAALLGTLDHDE